MTPPKMYASQCMVIIFSIAIIWLASSLPQSQHVFAAQFGKVTLKEPDPRYINWTKICATMYNYLQVNDNYVYYCTINGPYIEVPIKFPTDPDQRVAHDCFFSHSWYFNMDHYCQKLTHTRNEQNVGIIDNALRRQRSFLERYRLYQDWDRKEVDMCVCCANKRNDDGYNCNLWNITDEGVENDEQEIAYELPTTLDTVRMHQYFLSVLAHRKSYCAEKIKTSLCDEDFGYDENKLANIRMNFEESSDDEPNNEIESNTKEKKIVAKDNMVVEKQKGSKF